jgi:uncharacterized protein HemY
MGRSVDARREAGIFDRLKKTRPEFDRLTRELAQNPEADETRRQLARLCLETRRYREALDQFQVLALRTRRPEAFEAAARAAAALGQTRLAAEAREAAQAARTAARP